MAYLEDIPETDGPDSGGRPRKKSVLLTIFFYMLAALVQTFCLVYWIVGPTVGALVPLSLGGLGLIIAMVPGVRATSGRALAAALCNLTLALAIVPGYLRPSHYFQLSACKSNLKNLATCLEMYASDNQGCYPKSLLQVVAPEYMKVMPHCPEAASDTYSQSYELAIGSNRYTIFCAGHYHKPARLHANFPQYTSQAGLLVEPDSKP